MKTWVKYLIIGWSIVCIGIIVVSFQILKKDYIQEDFSIDLLLRTPEKVGDNIELIADFLYFDQNEKSLSKDQFIERIKGSKAIEFQSKHTVKNKSIYLYLPIYSFIIWAFPILLFTLLGVLFEKTRTISPNR